MLPPDTSCCCAPLSVLRSSLARLTWIQCGIRRLWRGARRPLLSPCRIENISGTASSRGKFLCAPEAPCSSISMRNVRLNVTGESKSCQCAGVFGTFTENCQPTPCLQRKVEKTLPFLCQAPCG